MVSAILWYQSARRGRAPGRVHYRLGPRALSRALLLVTARANTRRARQEEAQAPRVRHNLCSGLSVVPLPLPDLLWLHELAWRTHPSCITGEEPQRGTGTGHAWAALGRRPIPKYDGHSRVRGAS